MNTHHFKQRGYCITIGAARPALHRVNSGVCSGISHLLPPEGGEEHWRRVRPV